MTSSAWPTHCGANMPFAGHDVIGRIESDPAQRRQIGLHPGMGGVLGRTVVAALVIKIARDITAGNAPGPRDHSHDMGEVLADAAPCTERHLDRRMHLGDARFVFETIVDRLVEMLERAQRIALRMFDAGRIHERA